MGTQIELTSSTKIFKDIHDPIFTRVVLFENGSTRAAIVALDLAAVTDEMWDGMSKRIAAKYGIAREQILLTATHTHAGPTLRAGPEVAAYLVEVEKKVMEALAQAQARLQPVKVGAGKGRVNVNINRRALVPGGGYGLGRDPDGPSDKTLAVVKLESLAGKPIAILMNYAVHGTVMGPNNQSLSGDLPGAASRMVEDKLKDGLVALWTSGAAGDQAPLFNKSETFGEVDVLGRLMAEEAIRVAEGIRMTAGSRIRGFQEVVTCPGQRAVRVEGTNDWVFREAPPVSIRLSLLAIDHIAFAGVSGEPLTMIGERLKRESPLSNTILLNHVNGRSGYLADDEAYSKVSYEIQSTRAKKGCAESAIVNGFLAMMDRLVE